jgi:hypothetical protein
MGVSPDENQERKEIQQRPGSIGSGLDPDPGPYHDCHQQEGKQLAFIRSPATDIKSPTRQIRSMAGKNLTLPSLYLNNEKANMINNMINRYLRA